MGGFALHGSRMISFPIKARPGALSVDRHRHLPSLRIRRRFLEPPARIRVVARRGCKLLNDAPWTKTVWPSPPV